MKLKPHRLILIIAVAAILVAGIIYVIATNEKAPVVQGGRLDPKVTDIDRGDRTSVITDGALTDEVKKLPIGLLEDSNDESKKFLQEMLALVRSGKEESIDDAMLDANAMMDTTDRCDFVSEVLKLNDPDRSWQAVNMLVGYGNPQIVHVLKEAVDSNLDVDGMKSVMEAISFLGNAEPLSKLSGDDVDKQLTNLRNSLTLEQCDDLMDVINAGLKYEDEDVRASALDVSICLPVEMQAQIFWNALESNYGDLQKAVLNNTSSSPNTDTLLLAFAALDSADEDIRDAARHNVSIFISQEFENSQQAADWWARNRSRYDDELRLKNPAEDEEM